MARYPKLRDSDVTPEALFFQRRRVLKALGISTAALALTPSAQANLLSWFKGNDRPPAPPGDPLTFTRPAAWQADLPLTPEDKVSGYNNFYEFGLDKADPAANAGSLRTAGWKVTIDGEVAKPMTLDMDDILRRFPLEERIYRMRCVEAWSMVIPLVGFELGHLLRQAEPTSRARYIEGLRMDEAMHPLTLLSVGVYGKGLAPQNGAPIRLTVPWKYGFKSIKSIVHIRLVENAPPTTWNQLAPSEYGFYANVNPQVDHPRWSQASERFIGSGGLLDVKRQPTLAFNGYGAQVAALYQGMDLRKFY